MKAKITYNFNGGHWNFKDEVKEAFYSDLYHFVNNRTDTELKNIPMSEFVIMEPYIIGNMVGKYFLKEEVGGKLEDQPPSHFIGSCVSQKKYQELIPHLIDFFALWREIEQCNEKNATDFFASSWASLVDTAKFFKYTTVDELVNSPEAPSVRDQRILDKLHHCPEQVTAPTEVDPKLNQHVPKPRRIGYEFLGWYESPTFEGRPISMIHPKTNKDIALYAKWGTHTLFHSNDGYATFDDLYEDFLKDFSEHQGIVVKKTLERIPGHGWMSDFISRSFDGHLNKFFQRPKYFKKWMWLIEYLQSMYENNSEIASRFEYEEGQFRVEAQVRWELNSLFVGRFHLVWPRTRDYSGAGIKEKLANSSNSRIEKMKYVVHELVVFPPFALPKKRFSGWYETPNCEGLAVSSVTDDRYAAKTLFAKWTK